jgi:hypothetical protein
MKQWVLVLTDEQYSDLVRVAYKAWRASIRPAAKVVKMLDQLPTQPFDGDAQRLLEDIRSGRYRINGESEQESAPQESAPESPGLSHTGMRPKRGRRQSS